MDMLHIFACLLAASYISGCSAGHLDTFLVQKVANFSTWLKAMDLDPSPVVSGPYSFKVTRDDIADITFSMRACGHSEQISIDHRNVDVQFISAKSPYFILPLIVSGNITFYGTYSASGTLFSKIPIEGDGNWSISVPKMQLVSPYFSFDILPHGYLNNLWPSVSFVVLNDEWHDIKFDNLWDEGLAKQFKELLKELIFKRFEMFLDEYVPEPYDPLTRLYRQYWQETFSVTTLADILSTDVTASLPPARS